MILGILYPRQAKELAFGHPRRLSRLAINILCATGPRPVNRHIGVIGLTSDKQTHTRSCGAMRTWPARASVLAHGLPRVPYRVVQDVRRRYSCTSIATFLLGLMRIF